MCVCFPGVSHRVVGSREVCFCSTGWKNQEQAPPDGTCVSTPSSWILQRTPPSKLNVGVDLWAAGGVFYVGYKATLEKPLIKMALSTNSAVMWGPSGSVGCSEGSLCPWHLHLSNGRPSGSRWCLVCLMARDYASTLKSGQPFLVSHASLYRPIGFGLLVFYRAIIFIRGKKDLQSCWLQYLSPSVAVLMPIRFSVIFLNLGSALCIVLKNHKYF